MAIALDPARTWDYVLKSDMDLPKEEQTVWKMRTASQRMTLEIYDSVRMEDGEMKLVVGEAALSRKVVSDGLCGWENWNSSDGTPIEPVNRSDGGVIERLLSRIQPGHILELAGAMQNHVAPDEEDTEKPEPSPTA